MMSVGTFIIYYKKMADVTNAILIVIFTILLSLFTEFVNFVLVYRLPEYKKNVADLRNSLGLKIFQDLRKKNKKIKGYDPILNNTISKKNNLVVSSKEFKSFDIYILVTNHSIILRNLKKLDKNKTIINILD